MSDIKKALRKLGTKCIEAGHTVKGDTVGEILDCIGDHYAGGGNLPAVTAEDNNKVLTVVNGAWNKAAASGGAGIVYIDVTPTDETFATADVKLDGQAITGAEINALIDDKKEVKARVNTGGFMLICNVWRYSDTAVEFVSFTNNPVSNKLAIVDAYIAASGSTATLTFTDIENATAGE